ncbi:MAG: acetyl-CoA carboxylase biotin carboxyl carrier protein [Verrucomicrobiae bacterium]|nr:acetyl-CoA carboxylase biotin carboxyl carrier protein [Verrucomicrobiae bacterium]
MELKEIKAIIDLMKRNGLVEFELERDNQKIRIRRGTDGAFHSVAPAGASPLHGVPAAPPAPPPTAGPPALTVSDLKEIKSPMVGTFYRSPSPDAPPYVEIGQTVTEDTVVCLIEAMKVMNEIKAETAGVISEVCVDNAKPVEFGKPLFRLRPTSAAP